MSGSLQAGDVVAGRYRIEVLVGEGGFGGVYRAVQLTLDRPVALKVLHADLLVQEGGLARFEREARLAQRLEHPNVVRLYDFGTDESGVPFIAFELLKGQALDRIIAGGPLPISRVARIASQVLKGLMEAHGLGIVHRDIKPANIFLSDFAGEKDFVKVLDFGIAKSTITATSQGITLAGRVLGTPNYMSPESLLGKPPSPAADLYSLGLLMAEAIDGAMVIRGASAEACLAQISPTPVPLSPAVVSSQLGAVIKRATEKNVELRYATAAEMLRDLDAAMRNYVELAVPPTHDVRIQTSPATVASPPSASYAATVVGTTQRPPNPMSRALLILGAALGVLVLAGIGVTAWAVTRKKAPTHVKATHENGSDGESLAKKKKKKKPTPSSPADDDVDDNTNDTTKGDDDDDNNDNKAWPADGELNPEDVKRAMTDQGCTITAEKPIGDPPTWVGMSYGYERSSCFGVVSVLSFASEEYLNAAMNNLSQNESTRVKRHGMELLCVTGTTGAEALTLLQDIDP